MTRNQKRRALREHRRKMRYVAMWRGDERFFRVASPAPYALIWREYRWDGNLYA